MPLNVYAAFVTICFVLMAIILLVARYWNPTLDLFGDVQSHWPNKYILLALVLALIPGFQIFCACILGFYLVVVVFHGTIDFFERLINGNTRLNKFLASNMFKDNK